MRKKIIVVLILTSCLNLLYFKITSFLFKSLFYQNYYFYYRRINNNILCRKFMLLNSIKLLSCVYAYIVIAINVE